MYKEKGKIHAIGDIKSGVSTNGNQWSRQTFVLEVTLEGSNGAILNRIAIECGTKTVSQLAEHKVGDIVEVGFIINAREWQGRWFNNVDCVYIEYAGSKNSEPKKEAPAPKKTPELAPAFAAQPAENENGDLPF